MKIFPICTSKQRIINKINERNAEIRRIQVKIADNLSPEIKEIVTPLSDILARFGNKYAKKHGYRLFFSIEKGDGLFENHLKIKSYKEKLDRYIPSDDCDFPSIPYITRVPYKNILIDVNNNIRTNANDIKNMLS